MEASVISLILFSFILVFLIIELVTIYIKKAYKKNFIFFYLFVYCSMEKQYLKIDFNKVGEYYLKVLAWYKLLKLFDKEEWVSGGKIMKVTNRSVSSATKPLKNMGFEFEKRKTYLKGVGVVTQYRLTHTPKQFKKYK